MAFTSDAKSRWAAEWLSWPGFGKFWAQVVRHAMRKADAKGAIVQVDAKAGRATVTLDAVDPAGKYVNQAETELTVIDPRLGSQKLALNQTAPGRYVAEFDTPYPGAYHLEIAQTHGGKPLYRQSRGLMVGYPDELRLKPTNVELLRAIAQGTGGTYDPEPDTVFQSSGRTAQRPVPLWAYLIAAAALLFLADVALRRIDFSPMLKRLFKASRIALRSAKG